MKKFKIGFLGAALFLSVVGISFYLFSLRIDYLTTHSIQDRLIEMGNNNADSVVSMFEKDVKQLRKIAEHWEDSTTLVDDKSLEYLTGVADHTNYFRMAIDLPTGVSITSDGFDVEISDLNYMDKIMNGEVVLTEILKSKVENIPCYAIVVPIYSKGKVVGALRGVNKGNVLMDSVQSSSFSGKGYFHLIDGVGDFLLKSSKVQQVYNQQSIFEAMENTNFTKTYSLKKLQEDMKMGKSGFTEYYVGDEERSAYYMPIGINNWYIMSVTPSESLTQEKNNINMAAILFFLVLTTLFLILLRIIIVQNRREQKLVKRDRDYLERILNNIPLPLFITDGERRLLFINDEAVTLFGKKAASLLGEPCCSFGTSICQTSDCAIEKLEKEGIRHTQFEDNGKSFLVRSATIGERFGVDGRYIEILQDISSIKEAEQELKISEERYRIATQNTEDIIIDYDLVTKSVYHSAKAAEIYGVAERVENAPESLVESGVVLEKSAKDFMGVFELIKNGSAKASCELAARTVDGRVLWNRFTLTAIHNSNNEPARAIGILQDITREKEAERQYEKEARYRELTVRDAIFHYEADLTQQRFLEGHEQLVKAYATEPTDDFHTIVEFMLNHMVYIEDRDLVRSFIELDALLKAYEEGITRATFSYRREIGEGRLSWVECTLYIYEDGESGNIRSIGYLKDINEAKERELLLQQKAEHDLLTGLYNKVTTESLIKDFVLSSQNSAASGGFMLIDLDDFKNINDTLGHAYGDAVLSQISGKLAALFPKSAIVGRVGGDEFVVFLSQLSSIAEAGDKAKQICHMFRSAYTGNTGDYKISGSIGIAIFPEHGDSFSELYRKADCALYYAKKKGKDTFCLYNEGLLNHEEPILERERKIDDNTEQVFSEHIIEYVRMILGESADKERTVSAILELIAQHFNYGRSYIALQTEGSNDWCITSEWFSQEIGPVSQKRRKIGPLLTDVYKKLFTPEGFIYMKVAELPTSCRTLYEEQDIYRIVHFSIEKENRVVAVIGFDDYDKDRDIQETDLSVLQKVSQLLGDFLMD